MFVATLIAAGKLTDEVVREAIDRLDTTGHDVGAPHWIDEHDAADIFFQGSLVSARAELAKMDHGTLDVVVIAPRGLAAWVSVAARVLAKSGRSTQTVDRYRCREIEVHVDHDQMVELDGDIIGEARHIQIEVQPRALIVRTESGRSNTAA